MKTFCSLVALFLAVLLPARAETAADPVAVVQKTFEVALKHFGFTPESVKAQKSRVTPQLYALLWKKVNQPVPKGDAPDVDGDVFLDCQDLPQSFHVGSSTTDLGVENVEVRLTWGNESRHYVVRLKQIAGAWKIDDINFGKDGTMRDQLK